MIRDDSRARRPGRILAFVGLLAAAGSGAVGQQSPPYAASMTLTNSDLRAADIADFNGDGRLDVAVACGSQPTILVFLGDGYGGFTPAGTATFLVTSDDVLAAQLDGDGIPDLAITRANTVQILRGNGLGGLITGPMFLTSGPPRALAAGDFDADADLDLFSCNPQSATVSVARRNAAFTYTVMPLLHIGGLLRDVAVADVTGDGLLDVVVVDAAKTSSQPNGRVVVRRGLGNGSFVPHTVVTPSGFLGALDGIAIVDIDADGDRDLIGAAGAGIAVPLRNSGSGSFAQDPLVGSIPFSEGRLGIGDVDEDGDVDLVTFDTVAGVGFTPHLNDGSGAFPVAMPTTYVAGAPSAVHLAHVDGDRHLDALVAVANSSALFTLRGTGVGTFDLPAAPPLVSSSNLHTLSLGDLDNDGDLDVVRTRAINFSPFVDTLLNNGGFPPTPTTSVPSPFVLADAVVGDVTGDGFVDALVGDQIFSPPKIDLFANDGSGGLVDGLPVPLALPTGTLQDLELADLDADADLDLVLTTTAPNRVVVYLQIAGVFGAPNITSHTFISGASIDVDDVTGDGIPDIVAAAGSGGFVAMLMVGNGDGTFAPPLGFGFSFGLGANEVHLVDVDQDGDLDFVGVNGLNLPPGGEIIVLSLRNLGGGNFGSTQQQALDVSGAEEVAVGDVTDDGLPDLVFSTLFGVVVVPGVGAGTFANPFGFSPGAQPTAVALGEVDAAPGTDILVQRAPELSVWQPAPACVGRAGRYGVGCVGSGGFAPELSLTGCIEAGLAAELRVERGLGGSPALLLFGLVPSTIPFSSGCALQISPVLPSSFVLSLGGVGPGQGAISVLGHLPTTLVPGMHFTMQAVCADASMPSGFTMTNPLDVATQ